MDERSRERERHLKPPGSPQVRTDQELRERLAVASAVDSEPERSLAIVGVLNEAFGALTPPLAAVVVGGKAVDYWTGGMFATYDTDLLLPESDQIDACLRELGFERGTTRRHWEHPSLDVFIEMPGNALSSRQRAAVVQTLVPGGRVPVLSLVDTLIQRLHECAATGHADAAEQAVALRQAPGLDIVEFGRRVEEERLQQAVRGLDQLVAMVKAEETIEPWQIHEAFDTSR